MKKPLIVIAGPTACGKTGTSVELAKLINGEIISADSMQVYKYMDIGTAKATKEEMQGIKHYLIDELYPDEEFNVMIFQNSAKKYMAEIYDKNKIPILAGGTGFYINALVYDNDFMLINNNLEIRNELETAAKENGNEYVYNILKEIDPEYAGIVHANNLKRVIRAIEYYRLTGEKMSSHNKLAKEKESPYDTKFFILTMERSKLYQRIDLRVDKMIEEGLVSEVKKLLEMGYSPNLVSMQGLGYKEIVPYINGEITLEKAVYDIKIKTRHFAKRQMTWFNNQNKGMFIDMTNLNNIEAAKIIAENI